MSDQPLQTPQMVYSKGTWLSGAVSLAIFLFNQFVDFF
jgi:hypothetical protein